jgi:hypothetical protein
MGWVQDMLSKFDKMSEIEKKAFAIVIIILLIVVFGILITFHLI